MEGILLEILTSQNLFARNSMPNMLLKTFNSFIIMILKKSNFYPFFLRSSLPKLDIGIYSVFCD